MREKVMKTRWALPRRASSGVTTVMKPQVEADNRMTFSPPMLERTQREGRRWFCRQAEGHCCHTEPSGMGAAEVPPCRAEAHS
jgi:hypothetical protein